MTVVAQFSCLQVTLHSVQLSATTVTITKTKCKLTPYLYDRSNTVWVSLYIVHFVWFPFYILSYQHWWPSNITTSTCQSLCVCVCVCVCGSADNWYQSPTINKDWMSYDQHIHWTDSTTCYRLHCTGYCVWQNTNNPWNYLLRSCL